MFVDNQQANHTIYSLSIFTYLPTVLCNTLLFRDYKYININKYLFIYLSSYAWLPYLHLHTLIALILNNCITICTFFYEFEEKKWERKGKIMFIHTYLPYNNE